MTHTLAIDIETYAAVDLSACGVYRYATDPSFHILLFAYAFDDTGVQVVDIASGEILPGALLSALRDPDIVKTAYNANFERVCISRFFGLDLPVEQWQCTMFAASYVGLPASLDGTAQAIGLEQQKDSRGKALIRYFSKPCKPSRVNGGRTRNLPTHAPEKWEVFKAYCIQDIEVERAIRRKLERFQPPAGEQQLYAADQKINDYGIGVDSAFIRNAIRMGQDFQAQCFAQAQQLTRLENPNSVGQLKKWVEQEIGKPVSSLNKDGVQALLASGVSEKVKTVLRLRVVMAKTSTKKYVRMAQCMCSDGRIRGLLQFYGGNRTGRWSGKLLQPQNLPQNHLKDLDLARSVVCDGDLELLDLLYDKVPQTLSELIRTALVPSPGCRFIVSDFSAIEARVIAWLAGEQWRMDVFKTHGKIYEASAEQMFHLPAGSVKKGDPVRQKGKIAELALGYGGSVGAMMNMGALKMGLNEEELQPLVDTWRRANPAITGFWRTVQKAAIDALREKPSGIQHGIGFYKQSGILFIRLPSGRELAYVKPQISENRFGRPSITYMGVNQTTRKWERTETWGGKLVENIVQAVARDCLAENILRLHKAGFDIAFHVHDEVILDVPKEQSSAKEVAELMGRPISWAEGLPLRADAYECRYYQKD